MEIILLEKIDNVGGIGDKVSVKPGFARNYLLPQGKATLATPENLAKFEERRAELEKKANAELSAAQARAEKLQQLSLTIPAQAGSEGKLFGSIGPIDIARACSELGVEIERSEVRMPEGPLRTVGEHPVDFHLHTDVNVSMTVVVDGGTGVEPEQAQAEAPEEGQEEE